MALPHFLLVTFPAQGHINPSLQCAKRLKRLGVTVTFITALSGQRCMAKAATPSGVSFAFFSDGLDEATKFNDPERYLLELRRRGSQAMSDLIAKSEHEGRPFTCVIYTMLLSWVPEVARGFHIPSALLWVQPATVLGVYYYYFNGSAEAIRRDASNPMCLIELPGLIPLGGCDLPSFLHPSNTYTFALPAFHDQLEAFCEETSPLILVNTFDALEPEALKAIDKFNMIGIGPLISSAFLDGKDPKESSFGGDVLQSSDDYIRWLNSKPKSSVVYISFGTIAVLAKKQVEEVAQGMLDSGYPFLWVIRAKEKGEEEKEEDKLSRREELVKHGLIVPWCSQVEVLSHPSVGCFVTHCGWNSTLESLVCGVPMVAFPQWTDQTTNAKLVEDVWKTGVRVTANEEGIVESNEIKRCLQLVMEEGERAEQLRSNAQRWKQLGREAVAEGGSSDKNLKAFVESVQGGPQES